MTTIGTDPVLLRDAERLSDALEDLLRVVQFRDRDRICCHDVSVTQCYALRALVEDGPMGLNSLAESLYLDKSTAWSELLPTIAALCAVSLEAR